MIDDAQKELIRQAADLFQYPYEPISPCIQKVIDDLDQMYPIIGRELNRFSQSVERMEPCKVEELYVQTFDVQASCCLDVGYVLFGEDYKRGQFMAEIRKLEREYHVDTGTNLPDFLPHMLLLITRMSDEDARLLVSTFIFPAITKMAQTFDESKNAYRYLLRSMKDLLEEVYQPEIEEPLQALPVVQERQACQ